MSKVSIITPTYNSEKFIERAIRSVINQIFKDWEMIIVDDNSVDKTINIVKRLQQKDVRIKLIELKENSGGPAKPRTIGCKEAKGKYIAFLDHDDIFYPEYLELKIKYLDKYSQVDILSTFAWAFDEETKKIINYEYGGPVNMMVRRKVIEQGEYFKFEQNGADEIGVIYRYLLKDKNNFQKQKLLMSEPLTLYSRHLEQSSYVENKNPMKFVKRVKYLINDFFDKKLDKKKIKIIEKIKPFWYSRLGNFYCLAGKLKKGRKYFLKSLKIKINLFALGLLFLSFFEFKLYKKIETFLRMNIQRKVIWKLKTIYFKNKYSKSYNKAVEILKTLQ